MQESARAVNPEPGWSFMRRFLAEGPESAFVAALYDYVIQAGMAKMSAWAYTNTEVKDVVNARDALVHELTKDVKVLLATADAWCKMVAKAGARGLARTVVSQKEIAVMIVDNTQSCQLAAVTAACHMARTLVFLGDENQVIDIVQPNYRRTPWVSRDNPKDCEGELEVVDCETAVGDDEEPLQKTQRTSEGTEAGTGRVRSMGGGHGSVRSSSSGSFSGMQLRASEATRTSPQR